MSVHVVHPVTGGEAVVTEEQLAHMRASGWLTAAEHEENQAAAAAAKGKPSVKDEGK